MAVLTTAYAEQNTTQQISSPIMNGLAMSDKCCFTSDSSLSGNLIKSGNLVDLSLQSGNLTINEITYHITFEPVGKSTLTTDDACSSEMSYDQPGQIQLVSYDGTILTGTAHYSWGTASGCTDGSTYTFTNLSGEFVDSDSHTVRFYTGTDLLPEIH